MLGTHEDIHVEAANVVLSGLGATDRFDLAVLSGSRAAGLGHAYSDIDVHVVLREGASLDRRTHNANGVEIQLTVLPLTVVEEYAELTERYATTARGRAGGLLSGRQLWHMIRLSSGRTLLASDYCASLMARANYQVVRQVLMANHAHEVSRASEDALGMLADGDPVGATQAATVALTHACEVALAGADDIYAIDRFLLRRLGRATVFAEHMTELWPLLHTWPGWDARASALADAVQQRLLAACTLVGWSLLYGWDEPLTALPPLVTRSRIGPIRTPGYGLQRFADCWALAGPGKNLRVSEIVAATWIRLDGRPVGDVALDLGESGFPEATPEDVASGVANLVRLGVAAEVAATTIPSRAEGGCTA
jgi:hypothetical protein